jgi:hypothetical protein
MSDELKRGRLVALTTGRGDCYVDLNEVVSISAAVKKGNYAPSRRLALRGGSVDYILSNEANFAVLKPLLQAPEEAWVGTGKAPQPGKRGRPRRTPATAPED